MPALRERGLRRGCDAGPQVSETINSVERKADTMKTYLLRALKAVEPQKPAPPEAKAIYKQGPRKRKRPAQSTTRVEPPGALVGMTFTSSQIFPV